MLLGIFVFSLVWLAGLAIYAELWWEDRRARREDERMQAMVDALDA